MPFDRQSRLAELKTLHHYDRSALLTLYRRDGDLNQLAKQPGGVTFAAMIAAILDREEMQKGRG